MHDINWWLMAAGFVLGLLLTFAFMIRRVKVEVPVSEALRRSPNYKQIVHDVWFKDEESAQRAGFTHWGKGRKKLEPQRR